MDQNEPFDQLTCPICFEVPQKEIFQCPDGHTICNVCIIKIPKCPQCMADYSSTKIRNRALESLVDSLKSGCPNKNRGCKARFLLFDDLNLHIKECLYAKIEQYPQEIEDLELAIKLSLADTTDNSFRSKNAVTCTGYDLSGWKYTDLRDTINTSEDTDLLEACSQEFRRRLKAHQEQTMKKSSVKPEYNSNEYSQVDCKPGPPSAPPEECQRYFRTPLTKNGKIKGRWYGHFDGQHIARQMEIQAGESAVLLVAGRDDMQMRQRKLDETGLTKMQGTEITEFDFQLEWETHQRKK